MGLGDIFRIKEFKAEIERLKASNTSLFSDNQKLLSENSNRTIQRVRWDELYRDKKPHLPTRKRIFGERKKP